METTDRRQTRCPEPLRHFVGLLHPAPLYPSVIVDIDRIAEPVSRDLFDGGMRFGALTRLGLQGVQPAPGDPCKSC